MGAHVHRDIQFTKSQTVHTLVREINLYLIRLARTVTTNFRTSVPQIDAVVLANGTASIWLPTESFAIDSISTKVSVGTANVTLRVNGVTVGALVGATTTAAESVYSTPQTVNALDDVDLVVAGLTGVLVVAVKVRRLG